MSAPGAIKTTIARLRLDVLATDDLRRVHAAALELLGTAAAAAEAAAAEAPQSFTLGGRDEACDIVLGAGRCWLAAGGSAGAIRSQKDAGMRSASLTDVRTVCRLADALPEVGLIVGPPVRAEGARVLDELMACLAATHKHVQVVASLSPAEAAVVVRFAEALAGSAAAMRQRPPLSLVAGPESLEAALVFARAGLPVGLVLAPDRAPACGGLAGALVRHHAGVLAGCAAVQAAAPGAPFIYLAHPVLAGLPAAGSEAVLFEIAAAQLAAQLRLPVSAAAMLTASHEPDWQAGTQNALAALSTTTARIDITAGAGTLGGGSAFSLPHLVMGGEVFSWSAKIAEGIAVDDETIALDAIKDVGISGNYLGQRHTRRHMKDVWRPRVLDRSMWDAWVASGREGAYEKATDLVAQLISAAESASADSEEAAAESEVRATLARIVAEAGS